MTLLEKATPDKGESGLIMTLFGAPGTGKTSTALTFPSPFMIRTAGEAIPRDAKNSAVSLGLTETPDFLWEQMKALCQDQHDFKSLIVDSSTGLEGMFIRDVIEEDFKMKGGSKRRPINLCLGGYGAGRAAVAAHHARLRKGAEYLRTQRGMHIIFIGHADIERIDPPDSESYSKYSLRLHKESMKPYVDDVDVVGFLRQATILRGEDDERKKAVTSGEIVLTTTLHPAFTSKNRLGIREDIKVVQGENPLAAYL